MNLLDVWKKIQAQGGPHSVLLNKDGETQMTVLALQKNPDLWWDVIYIRNDGWSLGCDFYLAPYAENLHRCDWVAWIRRGDKAPRPLLLKPLDTDSATGV